MSDATNQDIITADASGVHVRTKRGVEYHASEAFLVTKDGRVPFSIEAWKAADEKPQIELGGTVTTTWLA